MTIKYNISYWIEYMRNLLSKNALEKMPYQYNHRSPAAQTVDFVVTPLLRKNVKGAETRSR